MALFIGLRLNYDDKMHQILFWSFRYLRTTVSRWKSTLALNLSRYSLLLFSPFRTLSGFHPFPSKNAWLVAKPLLLVIDLVVPEFSSVVLNKGFGTFFGFLNKSWVLDFHGSSFHAGWGLCKTVFPYLLENASFDLSTNESLLALNPLVERPSLFYPSLLLAKQSLVMGVYPLA